MLVALYLRVSTEDQARRGHSLPDQRQSCLAKAREIAAAEERNRGRPVHLQTVEFADTAGGDVLDRPELERLRNFVRQQRPAYVVCLDPDRFSRATYQAILVANEIEAAGTKLEFVQHDYQTTPEGRLFFTLRVAIAEYEKSKILERTARGRRSKIAGGGLPTGLHMFGYDYDCDTDEVTPNLDEAPWVTLIFQWAAEGMGCQLIANRLNAAGVAPKRGGARWYRSTVSKILRNSGYVGAIKVNRYDFTGLGQQRSLPPDRRTKRLTPRQKPMEEWVTIQVPPLVPQELWAAVQARRGEKPTRRAQVGLGLLSGLLTCGLCGGPIHYLPRSYGYIFRCANRYPAARERKIQPPKCSLPHLRAAPIDESVWSRITAAILDPAIIRRHQEEQQASGAIDDARTALELELGLVRQKLQEQQKAQERLLAVVAIGAVDPEVAAAQLMPYKEQTAQLRAQAERLESRLRNLAQSDAGLERQMSQLRAARETLVAVTQAEFRQRLAQLTLDQRRELVRMLVSAVRVLGQGVCEVVFLN